MRAADLRKTLAKFATTDRDFVAAVDADRVARVVRYELVTNRPFHPNLIAAIDGIRRSLTLSEDIADQAKAVTDACGIGQSALRSFLDRLALSGDSSTVSDVRASVHRTIANWGGSTDTLAKLRLSNLLRLCREKAGAPGQFNNLIGRVDVLAALEVGHEDDLFPTPAAFPAVGEIIDRPVVEQIAARIDEPGPPIVAHSPGGMGKTVVMQALARRLDNGANAVVLFYCFGAGRWRDPADGRHTVQRARAAYSQPARGARPFVTPYSQAARPPIWHEPFGADLSKQSKQCVPPIHAGASFFCWMRLTHSALQAAETHTEAFSHVILKSLAITPIDGVSVVASCRTERLEVATNGAECREIPIEPFSPHVTRRIVGLHDQTATDAEIAALQTRSGGNPRVLDALLRAGRPYDDIEPLRDETPSRADLLDGLLKQKNRRCGARGARERVVDERD